MRQLLQQASKQAVAKEKLLTSGGSGVRCLNYTPLIDAWDMGAKWQNWSRRKDRRMQTDDVHVARVCACVSQTVTCARVSRQMKVARGRSRS